MKPVCFIVVKIQFCVRVRKREQARLAISVDKLNRPYIRRPPFRFDIFFEIFAYYVCIKLALLNVIKPEISIRPMKRRNHNYSLIGVFILYESEKFIQSAAKGFVGKNKIAFFLCKVSVRLAVFVGRRNNPFGFLGEKFAYGDAAVEIVGSDKHAENVEIIPDFSFHALKLGKKMNRRCAVNPEAVNFRARFFGNVFEISLGRPGAERYRIAEKTYSVVFGYHLFYFLRYIFSFVPHCKTSFKRSVVSRARVSSYSARLSS